MIFCEIAKQTWLSFEVIDIQLKIRITPNIEFEIMFFYAFQFFQFLGFVSALYLDTHGMSSLQKGKTPMFQIKKTFNIVRFRSSSEKFRLELDCWRNFLFFSNLES